MRQILAIALTQFKMTVKSKGSLVMMFAMPLILTLIFGVLMGGMGGSNGTDHYPIVVVDHDQSFASQKLVEALSADPAFQVKVIDAAALDTVLTDKVTAAGAVIPAGYQQGLDSGTPPEIKLVTLPGANTELYVSPAVRKVVTQSAGDYRLARQTAGSADPVRLEQAYRTVLADRQSAGARVAPEKLTRLETRSAGVTYNVNSAALGFSVMFVMMMVFMQSSAILSEREHGTWGRMLTTPASRVKILLGFLLSFFIVGLFQFTVLVAATMLLFRIHWGPLFPLFVMASVFILCSAALGLFIAGIVRTADQQKAIGNIAVIATSMLGGVYWPLELMSPTLQRIGYMTPQAWAMEGFREVMLRGGAWAGLTIPIAVLASLTLIFMTAGLLRVKYE